MAFEVILLVILALVVFVVLFFVLTFNGLIVQRNRIDNSWSQIDVQLKKRVDLITNLVETVNAYAKHESSVFENVTKARTSFLNAQTVPQKAQATDMLSGALKSLFAVAENYPQLRANENFIMLQEEISSVEGKIAYARQFYNDTVLGFNNAVQTVPSNIVAMLFGFVQRDYFKISEAEKELPKVGELMKK
ncbi:MAG: LemA family protein [Candidatus Diapherotrites archaeon]|nr:LemA family protein [Candidatus Diapherotrites archaeon]